MDLTLRFLLDLYTGVHPIELCSDVGSPRSEDGGDA